MLLLVLAVPLGGLIGQLRAWRARLTPQLTLPRALWLVYLAFLPQCLAFYLPATRGSLPETWIGASLIFSQLVLLAFAWANRHQRPYQALGLGLAMNFAVIALNGGWMPITPQTVSQLAPDAPAGAWESGARLGTTKDRVLPIEQIRLPWLRDRFIPPTFVPVRAAFSVGDFLIALGVFWLLGFPKLSVAPPREETSAWTDTSIRSPGAAPSSFAPQS